MGSLSREPRSRSPPPERRADRTKARRSNDNDHAGSGAQRMELEIDGEDSSTTTADGSEQQQQIEGAAEEEVDTDIADGRSDERERWYGGRGVPRRPASGQAGPQAHAERSRGMAGQRRGVLEAFQAARGGTA